VARWSVAGWVWLAGALGGSVALAGGRTVTADTLQRAVGQPMWVSGVEGPAEVRRWSASCMATTPTTVACSLYDATGQLRRGWRTDAVQGDEVIVVDAGSPQGPAVRVPVPGAERVFTGTSGVEVPFGS